MQGPFVKSENTPERFKVQTSYRSDAKPFLDPLPYRISQIDSMTFSTAGNRASSSSLSTFAENFSGVAFERAYSTFVGKCAPDKLNLGETFGEFSQSSLMLTRRLSQFSSLLGALLKRDANRVIDVFHDIYGSRKLPVNKKRFRESLRDSSKTVADTFLELHLGWSPLVKEIQSLLRLISDAVPPPVVTGTGESLYHEILSDTPSLIFERLYVVKVRVRAHVRVSNADRWLFHQTGLDNPVLTAWNLMPWTFIFDYWVSVSAFLGGFTDLAGLELIRPQTTYKVTGFERRVYMDPGGIQPPVTLAWRSRSFRRELGIGTPDLIFRGFAPLSVGRAATVASLITQQLARMSRT